MDEQKIKPLLSVCIPTFNGERYIQESLNSKNRQNEECKAEHIWLDGFVKKHYFKYLPSRYKKEYLQDKFFFVKHYYQAKKKIKTVIKRMIFYYRKKNA